MQGEGEMQSYYSGTHGFQVPPPYFSKPNPSVAVTGSGGFGYSGNGYRGGMKQEDNFEGDEEGFATYVSYNAVLDDQFGSDAEEMCSQVLENLMTQDMSEYETPEQKKAKEQVLFKLNDILVLWMNRVKIQHGIPPDRPNTDAVLLCYGSYKLGVSSPSGDIDTLVLAPHFVKRNEDFFGKLHPLLLELAEQNPNIQDVTSVNQEHSVTPLIKMTFYGVPIDMIFATVQCSENLPEFLRTKLDNEDYMKHMDDKMKKSYNGYRNPESILRSIRRPGESELLSLKREEVFRITLKCIKLWAKNSGLVSNKLGYLGGISWALLTAKICKLYPYKSPAKLLERFFWLFGSEWKWDSFYVRIEKQKPDENRSIGRAMYVMTPAWPQMNSTHNATVSTRDILTARMRESHSVVQEILDKAESGENPTKQDWLTLFNSYNFFENYDHFIEINILGGADADYLRWLGFVEAKIRILVEKIEDLLKFYDLKIHPWPNNYERSSNTFPGYPHCTTAYIGLSLSQDYGDRVDLNLPVVRFIDYIENEWRRDNESRDPAVYNLCIVYRNGDEIPRDVLTGEIEAEAANSKEGSAKGDEEGKVPAAPELKFRRLSAQKSAMKDDLNEDEGMGNPDQDESEEQYMPNPIEVSAKIQEAASPKDKPPKLLNGDNALDLFAQFDQNFNSVHNMMSNPASLNKRSSPKNQDFSYANSFKQLKTDSLAGQGQKTHTPQSKQEAVSREAQKPSPNLPNSNTRHSTNSGQSEDEEDNKKENLLDDLLE